MRRWIYPLSAVIGVALALGACASSKDTGLPVGPTTPAASEKCSTVDMNDQLKFVPADCKIKAGETVTWVNAGAVPHTVTAEDQKTFDSGATTLINSKGEFKFTFDKAGTYEYYCRLHSAQGSRQGMVGKVVVEGS